MPKVHVGKTWRMLLLEIGLDPTSVLRKAGLPSGLFDGSGSRITLDDYFTLWSAISDGVENADLALRLGKIAVSDHFDPAFFAAMCSPDMNAAATRLSDYKKLVGAFTLKIDVNTMDTTIRFGCKYRPEVPLNMGLVEIVMLVNLVRRATRAQIVPRKVTVPAIVGQTAKLEAWLGCNLSIGNDYAVSLNAVDAKQPFLTHDDQVWHFFEPLIKGKIEESRQELCMCDEVERVLGEMLPSGRSTILDVARELAVSTRSLQRKLADEGTTWQAMLSRTREKYALHYLQSTSLGAHEISFLLGYKDPNSLFRAFHRWTGTTPELWRERRHP